MKFDRDVYEIKSLLRFSNVATQVDASACLSRFAAETNDSYLNARAQHILSTIKKDNELSALFNELAVLCNESRDCENCAVKKYCNNYICMKQEKERKADKPLIVDLFCGAGGLSLGFSQEGYSIALANDIQECCVDTYAHNHPEVERKNIVQGDIRYILNDLEAMLGKREIAVIVGGPPCQGFSMANRQRIIDDPRNFLYKNYVEMVDRVRPRFFVMENVRGMLSVSSQIISDFSRLGYDVAYKVVNAEEFGIPQNRERILFIGNRIGVDSSSIFAEMEALAAAQKHYSLADAIGDLRPLAASKVKYNGDYECEESGYIIEGNGAEEVGTYITQINDGKRFRFVFNHKARFNNERDIEIFSRMFPGDRADDPKIADIMPYSRRNGIFKDKYFKLEPTKVCKTITAHLKYDGNMYIHPYQARGLTPREAARIQSFPDDYFFRGSFTKTYMQIGNSVPPLLGRIVAHVIKKYV